MILTFSRTLKLAETSLTEIYVSMTCNLRTLSIYKFNKWF